MINKAHTIRRPHRTAPPKPERVKNALDNPIALIRENHRRSLFEFVLYFWQDYSNDEFVPNWHIKVLCDELEKVAHNVASGTPRPYDLVINIPPGTSKTAITSIFFPVWCWTQWHWMKFITASYGETLSLESADYSRDIIRSSRFKRIYPEIELRTDKDKKSNFKCVKKTYNEQGHPVVRQGGNRFSTSVGGSLTGFHGHINIIDDPLNPNQSLSEKEIARANHWSTQTLSTRKANKLTTTTITIMQRLHQNDPSGALLNDPKKRIRHICLPGEIKNYGDLVQPPELKKYYKDKLLDPVRMPWSVITDLKADLGQYGYAGQIGQKPTPPGGGMFRIDNFQIVQEMPDSKLIQQIVRYWDKAGTQGDGAFTAGVKMARLKTGIWLVMDVKRGQWSTDNREKMIDKTAQADGTHVHIFIEQEPGSGGKESAENTKKRLTRMGYKCTADRPQGDKIYRADPFSVQVNDGNVWILRQEWNSSFIEEFEYFPFGTYKDQVDAASGAYAKLTGKKQVKVISK